MKQVADVDQHRADHGPLPDEDEQRVDRRLLHQLRPRRERDMGDHGHRHTADLASRKPTATVAPDRRDDHPGRASLHERLEHRKGPEVVDPVARCDMSAERCDHPRESDQRLGEAETEPGRHAEDEPVHRLREVRAIRQVAEGEGRILTRVGSLMWLVTFAALFAAALAVGATSATTVLERRSEIGLMKALGASRRTVSAFFIAEQLLLALVGGIAGYAIGLELARILGIGIFGMAPTVRWILFPIVLVLAGVVALLGSLMPLERASRVDPVIALRAE